MAKISPTTRSKLRKLTVPMAVWRFLGMTTIQTINGLMSTLNYRTVRYDPAGDPADPHFVAPAIFVLWHEYIIFPLYIRPHSRLAMLISQHQDAEILSQMASLNGLEIVRGSTHRGGSNALKKILTDAHGTSLAITPDGPRGPRRQMAQGCVYLSSRLQVPIVPVGFGFDRPWRGRSWDKFAIPRPGSRARAVMGPRIQVPPDLGRNELEAHRLWIEQQLNDLTLAAEQWAEGKFLPTGAERLERSPATGDGNGSPRSARLRW